MITTHEDLFDQPLDMELDYREKKIKILSRGYGLVLIHYLTHSPYDISYWSESHGGAIGLDPHHFKSSFDQMVLGRKTQWDKSLQDPNLLRIKRIKSYDAYTAGDPTSSNPFRGFGGHLFFLQNLSTKEITKSNNLWHRGTIPREYHQSHPPTHQFLDYTPQNPIPFHPFNKKPSLSVEQQDIVNL